MKNLIPLFIFILLIVACVPSPTASGVVSSGATANPILIATAQADQYWRDAEATSQAYSVTVAANYERIQQTAQAAAGTAQAQQTQDALNLALTAGAATSQAQETRAVATQHAITTATAQAYLEGIATETSQAHRIQAAATAVAAATVTAFRATRQAYELEQAQAEAQREQVVTMATTILLLLTAVLFITLLAWFVWKVIPTLINRFSLVRYGQHGNPLLILSRNGHTVLTDPLRLLQAALTVDESGKIEMPELTPNQLQSLVTSGVLQTLIEQTRNAPGHPPQLPIETSRERQAGPFRSLLTNRYLPDPSPPPYPALVASSDSTAATETLPLPGAVAWPSLTSYGGQGLVLGLGSDEVITLDLAQTPHILLSGSSGAGKTRRALRPLVAQALAQGIMVVLLNESGADFSPFYDHPNAAILRGDVDDYVAFIEATLQEMHRRETRLRTARVSEWQRLPEALQDSPPLLIVIDEILSLAMLMTPRQQKEFWSLLAAYASRARKLAMGSIGALTDPTYRILGTGLNWREQCNARITFRVAKAAVSRAVLDAEGAETLTEGQFLAMLGKPNLVQGVAPNPTDADLIAYLAQHPQPVWQQPGWIQEVLPPECQPGHNQATPLFIAPQPRLPDGQPAPPVATGVHELQPRPDESQPVLQPAIVQPTLPLDTSRPPTATEQVYIQSLYAEGLSKNAVCRQVYGFKDGKTYAWITAALEAVANPPNGQHKELSDDE